MGNHTQVNPRHIFMALGESICASLEEFNDVLLCLFFHALPNPGKLLRVGLI